MDTRYLISNSKDQSIRLWDMRRFADESTIQKCREISNEISQVWDYRMGAQPRARQSTSVVFNLELINIVF